MRSRSATSPRHRSNRQHGVVGGEEDPVLATRRHEVQQRCGQALRRPRRRHQPEVAVLEHQPDRGVPPRVGAVDHAQLQLGEPEADPVEVDRVLRLRGQRRPGDAGVDAERRGRARSTSCTAGSRPRRSAGTCRRPRSSGRPSRTRPGGRATNDSSARSVFIGRSRFSPPTAEREAVGSRLGEAQRAAVARGRRRHQDRPLDAVARPCRRSARTAPGS